MSIQAFASSSWESCRVSLTLSKAALTSSLSPRTTVDVLRSSTAFTGMLRIQPQCGHLILRICSWSAMSALLVCDTALDLVPRGPVFRRDLRRQAARCGACDQLAHHAQKSAERAQALSLYLRLKLANAPNHSPFLSGSRLSTATVLPTTTWTIRSRVIPPPEPAGDHVPASGSSFSAASKASAPILSRSRAKSRRA